METVVYGRQEDDLVANGGYGANYVAGGAGSDILGGGQGDDCLDGLGGSDRLNGGSGADTLIYTLGQNKGATDLYMGGFGIDTVRIQLTLAEWQCEAVRQEILEYVNHLAVVRRNAQTGEVANGTASDFTLDFGDSTRLTVSMMENLVVVVDGQAIDPLAPFIISNGAGATAAVSIAENNTAVTTVSAIDLDSGTALIYSIVGGNDMAKFSINATTGALSFIAAPNFEAPGDVGGDNVYDVQVRVSDGNRSDTQSIAVTVTNVNEAPVITSDGGGATASVNVAENSTAVTAVAATDPDAGATLTYSIVGGADSAKFSINATTGALAFIAAPNFEAPGDVGANNVYDVQVQVSDGTLTDTQSIAVTVTNVNEAPAITSDGGGSTASVNVAENSTAVTTVAATDPDAGATLTYSIVGGDDSAKFSINATTGALAFIAAPNFEAPGDAGANNVYDVQVQVSDGSLTDTQSIAVTVTNVNEAPAITSDGGGSTASVNVAENSTAVTTVAATDPDFGAALTYSIVGGADSAKFSINATTGALAFIAAPNFEAPGDTGANNVYDVQVQVSDGSLTDTQSIAVTVTNVNEAPAISSDGGGATASVNVAENSTAVTAVAATDPDAGATLTYSIVGGDDSAKFSINATTGALAFIAAPNFEAPGDAGANNVYDVQVQVSDGSLTDTQSIAVTVTNVNEAPAITSDGGAATASVNVAENSTAVTTVAATDPDAGATLTYSIVGGGDSAKFSINATTGALAFLTAPNFEAAGDVGANNVYDVQVQVSDGSLADTQSIAVTVTNVNEAPAITSDGGGATASVNVAENSTAVTAVAATDPDAGATLTYSIVGGDDSAKFSINATTGALAFIAAPNYEAPGDVGANNVYDVQVQVSDGSLIDTQSIAVTVTNVNEAPTITSDGGGATASVNVAENSTAVTTVAATDPDAGATLTYSIVGGDDSTKFSINATTGALAFIAAPNYEAPGDVGANNVYDVQVEVSDGSLTDTQSIAVTVTNVNEAPAITSNGGGATASVNVAENSTAVTTVAATDPDMGATFTYSIVGGDDSAKFSINATTGVLAFLAAPNFEAPGDVGANNVYDVQVQVSDGTLTDTQSIAVTVTNVNEAPVAAADKIYVSDSTSVVIPWSWLLANDSNPGNAALSITSVTASNASLFTSGPAVAGQTVTFTTVGLGADTSTTLTYTLSNGSDTTVTGQVDLRLINFSNGADSWIFPAGSYQGAYIDANAGNDPLTTGNADDVLIGGEGNDVLIGGAGADVMTGSGGNDKFQYSSLVNVGASTGLSLAAADRITDFTRTGGGPGGNNDTIVIAGMAGTGTNYAEGATPASSYADALAAADAALGGLVIYYMTSTAADGGLLFVDTDGSGSADALIRLTGVTASNFDASLITG